MCAEQPLPASELSGLAKSILRDQTDKYKYKCAMSPLKDVCQSDTCVTREFGIPGDTAAAHSDDGIFVSGIASKRVAAEVWRRTLEQQTESPQVYRYGREIARIENGSLKVLTSEMLWQDIAQRFDFVKKERGQIKECDPPDALIKYIRNQAPAENPLPELLGVTTTPVLTLNGTVHGKQGYDPGSKMFYAPSVFVPDIPKEPTQADIAASVTLLCEVVFDFPFKHQSDQAHWIGMAILPFVRTLISGPTPLHIINKPRRGTGATLLGAVATTIKTGEPLTATSMPTKEDEFHKVIISKLLKASDFFFIDNTERVKSSAFAALLTTSYYEGRRLGMSEIVRLPVGCTFIMTGNNIDMGEDFPRRIIDIRLDAEMEDPTQNRDFKHRELTEWVIAERGRIIAAILTLARAWYVAGQPYSGKRKASYEQWSKVIGGILEVAGVKGFLQTPEERTDQGTDPIEEEERELIRCWIGFILKGKWDFDLDKPVKASQLFKMCVDEELMIVRRLLRAGHEGSAVPEFARTELHRMKDKTYTISTIYDETKPMRPPIIAKVERAVKRQDTWMWQLKVSNPGALVGLIPKDIHDFFRTI